MSRSANQKLKLLYVMQLLSRQSDEDHPVSVKQITDYLEARGITAERKSIYNDIETLRDFGMDVVMTKTPSVGYFVASRDFQQTELRLLADAVQSSKFITGKKTMELIRKIEGLGSVYDARRINDSIIVKDRIKNMNESIYYNVDQIQNGISSDRQIKFKYFEYSVRKERVYRHGGKIYQVSPYALIWNSENYYMVAYDVESQMIRHYRVDRMSGISNSAEPRIGREEFLKLDMSEYSGSHFGMFTGNEQRVRLKFQSKLINAVIDRFGKDTVIIPTDDGCFTTTVNVAVSEQFFGWLCGFGNGVEIIYPEDVIEKMRSHINGIYALYNMSENK